MTEGFPEAITPAWFSRMINSDFAQFNDPSPKHKDVKNYG